jgi:hypothetical protein
LINQLRNRIPNDTKTLTDGIENNE